jgi:RAD54-like protein 2
MSAQPKVDFIFSFQAKPLMQEYVPEILEHSSKFQIFFSILDETIRAGDRLLLFSQSLLALNLIEDFLQNGMTLRGKSVCFAFSSSQSFHIVLAFFLTDGVTSWANGINYFRLDGSTPAMERDRLINAFNASKDPAKIPLFMVKLTTACKDATRSTLFFRISGFHESRQFRY